MKRISKIIEIGIAAALLLGCSQVFAVSEYELDYASVSNGTENENYDFSAYDGETWTEENGYLDSDDITPYDTLSFKDEDAESYITMRNDAITFLEDSMTSSGYIEGIFRVPDPLVADEGVGIRIGASRGGTR